MIKDLIRDAKLIMKSLRQYKGVTIITPLFMVIEAGIEVLIPFLMSKLLSYIDDPVKAAKNFLIVNRIFDLQPNGVAEMRVVIF